MNSVTMLRSRGAQVTIRTKGAVLRTNQSGGVTQIVITPSLPIKRAA